MVRFQHVADSNHNILTLVVHESCTLHNKYLEGVISVRFNIDYWQLTVSPKILPTVVCKWSWTQSFPVVLCLRLKKLNFGILRCWLFFTTKNISVLLFLFSVLGYCRLRINKTTEHSGFSREPGDFPVQGTKINKTKLFVWNLPMEYNQEIYQIWVQKTTKKICSCGTSHLETQCQVVLS